MGLRRIETRETTNRSRGRSVSATQPEASRAEDSLQWISSRIPTVLVREIEAHARLSGATRSDAIREVLAIGMEAIRGREGVPGGRIEELLEAIEGVRVAVELLGPPAFGTQRLLAHWAAGNGGVKVNEDDLLAEVRCVGADEWEQAIAEAERGLPEAPAAGPDQERH
jgi:hypothetical protein